MYKKFLCFVVFWVVCSFCLANVAFSSVSKNFYSVNGISASATSVSSSEAKKKALENARSVAFNTVISRILPSDDLESVVVPDSYNMEKFIQTMKLNNERTTSTSYSANVDILINKKLMSEYLKNQGISALQDLPPSTLVIFKDGDNFGFGDAEYGEKNVVDFHTVSVDTSKFDFDKVGLSNFESLLTKYRANNVIFVSVRAIGGGLYRVEFRDKLLGISGSFDTMYHLFTTDFVKNVNDAYKKAILGNNISEYVSLVVPVYSLADWIDVKSKLSKLSVFKDMVVQALKFDKAQIKVKYNYDLNSVVSSLASLGFVIENKNGYLVLKR